MPVPQSSDMRHIIMSGLPLASISLPWQAMNSILKPFLNIDFIQISNGPVLFMKKVRVGRTFETSVRKTVYKWHMTILIHFCVLYFNY